MIDTGCKDRKGHAIKVGDLLKWIRDVEYFKSGAKKGQVKLAASEFVAGRVIQTDKPGYPFWCKGLEADEKTDPFSDLPGGLNFMTMLQYIEIIDTPEARS